MVTIEKDFSNRTEFPGVEGNRFDIVLHGADFVTRIPAPIFGALLFFLAALPTYGIWPLTFVLWGFFLLDWLLLALLPVMGISYGPPKPPVAVLAVARTVVAFIPFPVPLVALLLQVIGTALVVYAFYIEPHSIRVTHQSLASPKLRASTHLRVLHLGDLHIERITRREQQLLRLVDELKPDLILFTGDFLNLSYRRDPKAIQDAREVLAKLKAPLGVFAVTGSPAVDLTDVVPNMLKDMPLRWLRDEKVSLQVGEDVIDLLGVSCSHRPFEDGPHLAKLAEQDRSRFNILLYHSPDLAPIAATNGVDLQLSGHTHGGQVRLPFYGALFTGSLYGKRYEAGRYAHDDMVLYITRGIGLEGAGAPRVRFLCPPEIILWEIGATR